MTDENEEMPEPMRQTYEEWMEQIHDSLSPEALVDFERLMETLPSLDDNTASPPEILAVNEEALMQFIEVSASLIVNVAMSKPDGERALLPMALTTGILLGHQLAQQEIE